MFSKISSRNIQLTDTYVCRSTDVKEEENKGNGDSLIEIDTGKVYLFDAEGSAGEKWVEM